LGLFQSHAGATTASNADEVAALLHEWKRDQLALKQRFDGNRDGEIDATEWAAARRAAEQEVAGFASRNNLPPAVDTLVDPRDARRPFILSATTEQALFSRAIWRTVIFGAIAFAGAALAICGVGARL
jgi:hypothetical protein